MKSHAGLMLFTFTLCLVALSRTLLGRPVQSRSHLQSGTAYGRIELQASAATDDSMITLWMRVAVTLIVLAGALFLILSRHYDSDQQKWAFGAVGTILGYWLKG